MPPGNGKALDPRLKSWACGPCSVNPKGQVTIPEPLRDRYGFPPGTKVVWLERDGDLIPKPLLSVEQLRGRFKGAELAVLLLEERARDRKHEDD